MARKGAKSGFGTITKLPSGKYRLRYTGPDGLRHNARVTFTTKAEAEKERARILHAIERNTWRADETPEAGEVDSRTMTLKALAEYWRDGRVTSKGRQLSPKTLHEYQRLIENTLASFSNKPIRQISRQHIEAWRSKEIKRAPNQTTKAYKHLKTLFTFALKRHWVTENPCDLERATSYTSPKKPAPTLEQVEQMLSEATGPFKAVLALASWGGLRKAEILALTRGDLETRTGADGSPETWVHITKQVEWNGKQKGLREPKADSIRSLVLPPRAVTILNEHLKNVAIHKEALLFERSPGSGEHWGEHQHRPAWEKLRKSAGYPFNFHLLRSFHSTAVAQLGLTNQELMDRMGHKDIRTAMIYQRSTGRETALIKGLG
jgi:integrase